MDLMPCVWLLINCGMVRRHHVLFVYVCVYVSVCVCVCDAGLCRVMCCVVLC